MAPASAEGESPGAAPGSFGVSAELTCLYSGKRSAFDGSSLNKFKDHFLQE
jgi:hypothetical protein